jgi:hypothetical protein
MHFSPTIIYKPKEIGVGRLNKKRIIIPIIIPIIIRFFGHFGDLKKMFL